MNGELNAVAVGSGGVWAVGGTDTGAMLIINTTDGGAHWTITTPVVGLVNILFGVVVVNSSDIWAVGDYQDTTGPIRTLAMHYNGTSWTQVSSDTPSGYHAVLLGISADAAGHIWAVGAKTPFSTSQQTALTEQWNGTRFAEVSTPVNPSANVALFGVAVVSATQTWAVGKIDTETLLLRWNGSSWHTVSSPDPGTDNKLSAVMVDSQGDVRAAGSSFVNGMWAPLFERWYSSEVAYPAFYDQRLSQDYTLSGVAGVSTDDVWAVGDITLTEHYDGLSWEIVPAEFVGAYSQQFSGVAVDSAGTAWAVGSYQDSKFGNAKPLVEQHARPQALLSPRHTTSYYVADMSLLQSQGCSAAQGITSGIILLDFGKPAISQTTQGMLSGTVLFDYASTFVSTDQISNAVGAFATGFHNCTPPIMFPPFITITVGTNNYYSDTTDVMFTASKAQDHGQAWAQMVSNIYTYLKIQGYLSQIKVAGASDMELGWNNPSRTIAWAIGFNSAAAGHRYYNFGDCEGCSYNMTQAWQPIDVYTVSWGIKAALPLPEIYAIDGGWAKGWQQVAVLTKDTPPYRRMIFAGSFTQRGACESDPLRWSLCLTQLTYNTPYTGWIQLWQALNYDPSERTAQDLEWATDITYNH